MSPYVEFALKYSRETKTRWEEGGDRKKQDWQNIVKCSTEWWIYGTLSAFEIFTI